MAQPGGVLTSSSPGFAVQFDDAHLQACALVRESLLQHTRYARAQSLSGTGQRHTADGQQRGGRKAVTEPTHEIHFTNACAQRKKDCFGCLRLQDDGACAVAMRALTRISHRWRRARSARFRSRTRNSGTPLRYRPGRA